MSHGSFGDLLRTHRLKLGLTQEGVAERAGLSVHAIQKLERGTTHPYRDTTNRLVGALGLSTEDEAEFHGAHVSLPRSFSWPKPVQQPRVRTLVGGGAGPSTGQIAPNP